MGNKRESGANLGSSGSHPREVKTRSVVLRAGFVSTKAHEGQLVRVSESDWLELVLGSVSADHCS